MLDLFFKGIFMKGCSALFFFAVILPFYAFAQHEHHDPPPTKEKQKSRLIIHGNSFLTGIKESGTRGRTAIAVPNMLMMDLGTGLGDKHFFNINLMGTAERWTFPARGY